ncbi:hypothetical protein C8Q74DRAFT_619348 [Fomes fomentarius]|nr:hypothetical protein C8Q74DRAFT_619348 [Fomes fomentarius]
MMPAPLAAPAFGPSPAVLSAALVLASESRRAGRTRACAADKCIAHIVSRVQLPQIFPRIQRATIHQYHRDFPAFEPPIARAFKASSRACALVLFLDRAHHLPDAKPISKQSQNTSTSPSCPRAHREPTPSPRLRDRVHGQARSRRSPAATSLANSGRTTHFDALRRPRRLPPVRAQSLMSLLLAAVRAQGRPNQWQNDKHSPRWHAAHIPAMAHKT